MTSQKPSGASDINNRARLLQAATDSFAEYGYEGASLRTIADNAGVSFQLITYYFGSKEELWVATVDYLYERYLETGKGLGFNVSSNVYEQFHNHLRLLLTDMLQRPQLRKIWIQEYLAGSARYTNVILPKIDHLHENLALPYYKEVVRLGIVKKFTPEELGLLYSSIVQNNVVYPHYIELLLGLPPGSPKSVETQIDLIFRILTEEPDSHADAPSEETAAPATPTQLRAETQATPGEGSVVYAWKESREAAARPDSARIKQLEMENLHLKQLIGSLTLEKKILLEKLQEKSS